MRRVVCKKCRSRPKEERNRALWLDEVLGFLDQSNISTKNIERLRRLEECGIDDVIEVATFVRQVAKAKPRKKRRWKWLREKRLDLFAIKSQRLWISTNKHAASWPTPFAVRESYDAPQAGRPSQKTKTCAHVVRLRLFACRRTTLWEMPLIGSVNRGQWDAADDFDIRGNQIWLTRPGRQKAIQLFESRLQESYKHPFTGQSMTYFRIIELEARLLEKEWTGSPCLHDCGCVNKIRRACRSLPKMLSFF